MRARPDRTLALSTTLIDYLILGDANVAKSVPRTFHMDSLLTADERTRAEQVALGFFMLSHFIADACMPCHCDARALSSFDGELHPRWEGLIETKVGSTFTDNKLSATSCQPSALLEKAMAIDKSYGLTFDQPIPAIADNDVWKELVAVCRASFAIASIVAPPSSYPYEGKGILPLQDVPAALLAKATTTIVHDAVLNVAITWKNVWGRFGR